MKIYGNISPALPYLAILLACLHVGCAGNNRSAMPARGTDADFADPGMSGQVAMSVGPFAIDPAAALYIVVGNEPVDVRLTVRRNHRSEGDRLTVRAFDPEENLTFWQFVNSGKMRDTLGPGDMEVYGIPIQIPVKPTPNELLYDTTISLQGRGVHQIRLSAGARNSVATLFFSRPVSYGISFQNGWYTPWDTDLRQAYAYVPPHAQYLRITGDAMTVSDEKGGILLGADDESGKQELAITKHRVLLKIDLPSGEGFKFRASGFPLILCPTAEAAKEIKASVIELEDGTVVCHKFQVGIAELLPELLKPENVGKAEELIQPEEALKGICLADPLRGKYLAASGSFLRAVPEILKNQNVDPASHWGGSFGGKDGWQERIDQPYPENRWDTLGSSKGLYAGTSRNNSDGDCLAYACLTDIEGNPYFGKKELLTRAAAASLRDLMTLGEDETWRGIGADDTDYAGMMAFAVGQKTFPVFGHVAPHMPEAIREVWTEGLRHIVDRIYPENMVTCRNQSSHYLVAFEAFAQGSGLPRYHELSRAYARRFRDEAHPSGYQIEQCGPDASYIGMTHWHEAVYYRMSQDPVILDSLRASYGFFNKTVAPEPDGRRILGGFNFNHRIGAGFASEQWGGAKGILDDVLPEVGLWTRFRPRDEEAREKATQSILKSLAAPPAEHHSMLTTMNYPYYAENPDQSMLLPAEITEPFIDNHNDELITVRRPGYYTVIYVGHPVTTDHYIRPRHNFRMPYPNDAENRPGMVNVRKTTPYVGGGMSLFWTPAFGTAIMSTNWSPVYRHGLVAQQTDEARYWENYASTRFALDRKAGTLTVSGRIENQPLTYVRTYHFDRDALRVELTLTATKDLALKRLFEVFPFPTESVKADGMIVTVNGKNIGDVEAQQLMFADRKGNGVQVDFDDTRSMKLAPPGLKRYSMQMCRAELKLPAQWQAGETHSLKYTISPFTAVEQ